MGSVKGIPALAATLALLTVLAGCGIGMTAEQRVERARDYLAANDAPAAIIELKNALQEDPVHLEARLLLAEASLKAGDAATAVKEFERAVDLGADVDAIRLAYAEALVRTGRSARALELADPEAAPAAERPRVHWMRGLALTALGRFDEAGEAFDIARQDPDQAFAADIGRARLALARGDLAAARAVLDSLGTAGERDAEYWEILAFVQLREGEPGAAAESLRNAIKHVKESFGAQRFLLRGSLAEALLSDGKVEEARTVAERLLGDARQHPLPNYLMSRVEYQSGNHQQALAYAQALLSVQRNSPIGNTMAGAASLAMNQPAQAESYLSRAVEADPENVVARKLLAQTRLGLGAPRDALAALRPVAGRDSGAASMAGMASIQAGDPEAAIELFQRELEDDPDNDTVRMQLVVGLMAAGRNDEALAQLGLLKDLDDAEQVRADLIGVAVHLRALDLNAARAAAATAAEGRPNDPQLRNTLGAMFLAANEADDAAAWFEDALRVQPGNAAAEFNLGRIAAAAGRIDEAETRFRAVLAAEPDNPAAKTALAQVAWSTGRRAEAIRQLEALNESPGAALPPRLLLARYLQAEGERDRAIEVARKAAQDYPENADAANALGRMLYDAGQHAEALSAFRRAIELVPGNPQLLLSSARARAALGEIDEARNELRNALAVDPDFTPARQALVDIERRTGRLEAAAEGIAYLKRNAAANDPSVALLEGELLLARREYEAAIPAFETAIAGDIGGRAVVGLFQAQERAGRPEAVRTLEESLEENPDDVLVRVLAADHYLTTGNHAAAIAHYETIQRRLPDNPVMLNNLAWLYARTGDSRALATAERALEFAPDSPQVMDTLGWILHEQGDNARAIELIREARELAPDMPEIRYHHAVLLAETGDRDGAIREARALLGDETAVGYHDEAQALLDRLGR
ncbi:MAG TPA: XrtA/PEP-CTERM system TPR-repeat protein PrsT [Gammaproteobacteria bacterium]|nr:XrtA/PEP-CTERM system TPR-repeat protein PrsT [Gammaproteobacteria bacterium]